MKHKQNILACLAAALMLTGCASGETAHVSDGTQGDGINIVDAGAFAQGIQQEEVSVPAVTATGATSATVATTQSTTTASTTVATAESTTASSATEASTTAATTTTTTATTATTTTTAATTAAPVEQRPDIGTSTYTALNHDEIQGVWISYLEYSDMMTGQSETGFRGNIGQALDNCLSLGLNTVYVHARSHGDAYYRSELFPWSKYVTGRMGEAPDYDPLEVIIEEAHSRGISVQAWINPLRLCGSSDLAAYEGLALGEWTDSGRIQEVSGYCYLNPAYEETIQLIADGAAEIVANYDVDGLHIDDYFYPTTEAWFDSEEFAGSGYGSLSEFRFDNCDRLVEALYEAVKGANPTALFSVSCQGSIENNYDKMYADVEKWCTQSGYLDYIVPQIYYGFQNSTQPYEQCLSRWEEMTSRGGIPLVTGLSVYKIGVEDTWAGAGKSEWITDSAILSRQLLSARECTSYGGAVLYSYRSIFSCDSAVEEQVWDEIAEYTALITQ